MAAIDLPGPSPPSLPSRLSSGVEGGLTVNAKATPVASSALPAAADPRHEAIAVAAADLVPAVRGRRGTVLETVRAPDDTLILGLLLCGDELDPDQVSRRMGCEPTSSLRSGARLHADALPCPVGTWRLQVRGDASTHASDLVEELLGRFTAEPSFWQALHRDFALQLHLSLHTAAPDAGFILAPEALTRCAATGASLLVTFHVHDADS